MNAHQPTPSLPAEFSAAAQQVRQQLTAAGAPFELENITVPHNGAARSYRAFKNAPRLLTDVLDMGRAHGDAEFLICGDTRLTFNQFYAEADAAARALQQQLQLGRDRTGMVCAVNSPRWAQAFAAIAYTGAVVAPGNSYARHDALLHYIALVQPDVMLCDQRVFARIADDVRDGQLHVKGKPLPTRFVLLDANGDSLLSDGVMRWEDLVEDKNTSTTAPPNATTQNATLQPTHASPDDTAVILSTSGTSSGMAKATISTHRSVCQALTFFDYLGALSAALSPKRIQHLMQRPPVPMTTLNVVPLFHVSGLYTQFISNLKHGRRLLIMPRWNAVHALELIEREQVTQFNCAPSMLKQLFELPAFHDTNAMKTLAGVGMGGAASAPHLVDTLDKRFPHALIGSGYGLTESNGIGSAALGDVYLCQEDNSGMVAPIVEMRSIDEQGNALATGGIGELQIRSVTVMQGYLNNAEATEQALDADGWLSTGDVGRIDENGFVQIVARIKDVIIRYGENISANWVESAITAHPAVLEAAVVGLPNEKCGEEVGALVRLNAGQALGTEELQSYLQEKIAHYKIPTVVRFTEQPLPRNETSKLLKKEIKQHMLNKQA